MPTLARFAERLTTPLLPADYLDVINPLLSAAVKPEVSSSCHQPTRSEKSLWQNALPVSVKLSPPPASVASISTD